MKDYLGALPFNVWVEESNISQNLSYLVLDLATDGTMDIGFFNIVHENYDDITLQAFLEYYAVNPINLESTRPIYLSDFDFSSYDLVRTLRHGGEMNMEELFREELNDPNYDLSKFDLTEMLYSVYGDDEIYDIREWETGMMF